MEGSSNYGPEKRLHILTTPEGVQLFEFNPRAATNELLRVAIGIAQGTATEADRFDLRDLAVTRILETLIDYIDDVSTGVIDLLRAGSEANPLDTIKALGLAAQALTRTASVSCADASYRRLAGTMEAQLEVGNLVQLAQWLERRGLLRRITSVPHAMRGDNPYVLMRMVEGGKPDFEFQTLD